jgi:hypothetical protein
MLKPSAAPSVNQSSIKSAICAGGGEMPAVAGQIRQQLPQGRLVPPHQVEDHLGTTARRLHRVRIGEILRYKRAIERQVGREAGSQNRRPLRSAQKRRDKAGECSGVQ